jgi:hypothetical protein
MVPMLAALPFAVITPRILERFGRGESLLPTVELPIRAAAFGLAPLLAGGASIVDAVVTSFFPNLAGGESATIAAIASSLPIVLAGFAANVFFAYDRQAACVFITGVSALLSGISGLIGAKLGFGIAGVAVGTALGAVLYFLGLTIASYQLMDAPVTRALRVVSSALAPCAVLLGIVCAGRMLSTALGWGPWVRAAALICATTPLSLLCVRVGMRNMRTLHALR